ncbi:DMT family transporter [Psychromarinibacter sp. C21-152]|uniref:DMT family transporter n=1 Tax=Psychromarinibacter sediminicola TaxID=3033385 RepID=A0AAE3NS25_9RHOB|nr:DMT family transporter [Psychromarinibacter sediminicola]MDF0602488.1 DMT family transporter [Psychromarinibacter sediminicola]
MRPARLGATATGILLILGAMLLLSTMDALAKQVAQETHPIMATWARYLGQTVVVFVVVIPRMPRVFHTAYPGLQFLRSLFLLLATTCFFFSITLIGLAGSTAVLNLNPVLITLGAALFLGERFGPRRAFAVAAALAGALIVIRPGSAVFSLWSLLPLVSAVFVAAYSLTTRFVGRGEDAWTSLLYAAAFGALVLSVAVPFFWVPPDAATWVLMALMGPIGSLGHLFLIRAYMAAEASAIAPFAYAQLLFSTIWAMTFFGEVPDRWTVLGALVIVGAGLYVWHRETRAAPTPSPPEA